jgi:hypothetical protein
MHHEKEIQIQKTESGVIQEETERRSSSIQRPTCGYESGQKSKREGRFWRVLKLGLLSFIAWQTGCRATTAFEASDLNIGSAHVGTIGFTNSTSILP